VPAFGGRALPVPIRLGIAVLLASFGLPHLLPAAAGILVAGWGPAAWLLIAAREALIGAVVGLVVSFFFRAAEMAGGLVDVLRGANLGEVLSPASGARTSPVGALYALLATTIFLELGGLERLAVALGRGYQALPVAGGGAGAPLAGAALGQGLRLAFELVLAASARLLESAIGLAAPVIVALLLTDLALGAVGRITPAIPVYFAAMPLKALLGVGVVLLGLGALDAALVAGLPAWIRFAERGFGLSAP
jgi:type III secretory pathway component EscT